jgi:uncharacterized protein
MDFHPFVDALTAVPAPLAAYSVAVVFLGYVVLGVSGFGSALTIVPLLALRWPLVTVVPMVLLLDTPSSVLLARLNMQRICWPELKPLVPGMLIGAAVGAWLAQWTAQPWALLALGVYVVGVALRGFFGVRAKTVSGRRWALLAGAAAGIVESIFGTAGPLVVAWLTRRLTDPQAVRANVPAAMVSATCFALLGMTVTGQLAQPILWGALPALVLAAFAGTRIGHHIAGRMAPLLLARIIFALLALAGSAMILRGAG